MGIRIGAGYHKKYGGAHAEVEAVQSVESPDALKDATVYVTLEPCSHHGKTSPCADFTCFPSYKGMWLLPRKILTHWLMEVGLKN